MKNAEMQKCRNAECRMGQSPEKRFKYGKIVKTQQAEHWQVWNEIILHSAFCLLHYG